MHYAWWILIACCAIQAGSQGTVFDTVGLFNSPVCNELGFEIGSFSLAQTFSAVAMMVSQPFTTYFYRKFDMRNILLISGIFYFSSHFCLSLSYELWHWYLLMSIQGIAGGFFYRTSYTILLCKWFASKTATALGIATAVGSIMGMLMNPFASFIIEGFGWRYCYSILALIGAIITLPIIFIVVKDTPEKIGLKPYVDSNIDKEKSDTLFEGKYSTDYCILVCSLLIASASLSYFCGGYYPHLPNYCVSIGMGIAAGSLMTSFELAGSMIMRFLIGPLLDMAGYVKTELVLFIFTIVGYVSYFIFEGNILFFTTALCGIYCSTNMVVMPLFAREQVGEKNFQIILPWMMTAGGAISSLSNTLYGYLFDKSGNYDLMFIICILSVTVSFSLIIFIKLIERKKKNIILKEGE